MKKNYYYLSTLALVLMALCSCSKSEQIEVTDLDVFGINGPVAHYLLAEVETDSVFTVPDSAIAMQSFDFDCGMLVKMNGVDYTNDGKLYDEMGRLTSLTTPDVEVDGKLYDYEEFLHYAEDEDILPETVWFIYNEQDSDNSYTAGYKLYFWDEDGHEVATFSFRYNGEEDLDFIASFYDITAMDDYGNWTSRECVAFLLHEEPEDLSYEYLKKLDPNPTYTIQYQVFEYEE